MGLVACYRPQRSCEGYVFTRVCHSVLGGAIPACTAGGITACLAVGGACSWGSAAGGGGCLLGGCLIRGCLLGGCGDLLPPKKQTATVADGMHPTEMHSC